MELPKAYDPSLYEDDIYKKWEDSGFFNPDNLDLADGVKSFSIVMPPPNVTGVLHIGHASMLALEDILTRYHRMKGERALWIPGTDHAAIATQAKVEKILKDEGTNRHKLGKEKFLERVREFAQQSHDTINKQCKKMGSSCDWSREAYTLDAIRTKAVRSVFKLMYDDGLIYRGDRIVNWCPQCHSTLSDDEVEHKEQKNAKFYTFKYNNEFPFAISTTRPETKLGDTAVAVNPKDERYRQYIGQVFDVDFCGVPLKIKVIGDYKVDSEFGTGALGVTPAHSSVDWQMAEENNLEIIKVIDEDGKIRDGFGEYSRLTAKEARQKIVTSLQENNLIEKEEEVNNNLSICYRCSTSIEPLPSLQWFINVNKKISKFNKSIEELSIEAVRSGAFGHEKINIIPERFEKNYYHWMENLRDWCISRQIIFGHQVPVWYRDNETYVGVDAPEGDGWTQDEDSLDTWFSSGLWTFSTMASSPEQIKIENGKLVIDSADFKHFHPNNIMETGYDILFFWVARMIIMTTYAIEDIPFQDVYLHGLVNDEKGKKMSKSVGNVIDPLDMIVKYGTDAVRMSLIAGTTPGNDLRMSEEKIESYRNFVNKLWNVARYVVTSYDLSGIKNNELSVEFFGKLTLWDRWILAELRRVAFFVEQNLTKYEFSAVAEELRRFTVDTLADWYLEVSKFEKNPEKNVVLNIVLRDLLKLWHPFIPFVTEHIWSYLGNDKFLMIDQYPSQHKYDEEWVGLIECGVYEQIKVVQDIITSIRNARSENKVEPTRKIKAIVYAGDKVEMVKLQEVLIKSLRTGIEELEIVASGEEVKDAIFVVVGDIKIYLLGAIDEEKEKARIQKEIERLEKFVASLEAKLSNKEFTDKAPEMVVNKEKARLEEVKVELENLKK